MGVCALREQQMAWPQAFSSGGSAAYAAVSASQPVCNMFVAWLKSGAPKHRVSMVFPLDFP